MTKPVRRLLTVLIGLILGVAVITSVGAPGGMDVFTRRPSGHIRFDELMSDLSAKRVKTAVWQENQLTGELINGAEYSVTVPDKDSSAGNQLLTFLEASGTRFQFARPSTSSMLISVLSVVAFPLMILSVLYFMFVRPHTLANGTAMASTNTMVRTNPVEALFTGATNQETTRFVIPQGRFAHFVWSASPRAFDPNGSDEVFTATLRNAFDGANVQLIASIFGEGNGTTKCLHQGTFYFEVVAEECWTIKVHLA